jgi:hypothetical protein
VTHSPSVAFAYQAASAAFALPVILQPAFRFVAGYDGSCD